MTTFNKLMRLVETAAKTEDLGTDADGLTRLLVTTKDGKHFEVKFRVPTDEELAASIAAFERDHLGDAA